MKKYLCFLLLFGFFFPLIHKIAFSVHMFFQNGDPVLLLSYYHDYGLLSMKNLLISSIAGTAAFFFTNIFGKWDREKKQR